MKYLLEIHHGIGDVIQMTCVVETLYRTDPKAEIYLILGQKAYASIFQNDERIKGIFYINIHGSMTKWELLKSIIVMRKKKFDYMIFPWISNKLCSHVLAFMVNAKVTCGEQFDWIARYSKKFVAVKKLIDEHRVLRYQQSLIDAGLANKVYDPKLCGIDEVRSKLKQKYRLPSGKVVGICIGTTLKAKNWVIEKYLKVAQLLSDGGLLVYFIGGETEENRYSSCGVSKDKSWVDLMGRLNLIESIAMVTDCDFVIGGDTGMMHAAAASGVKTITIFGPSDPIINQPYPLNGCYVTAGISCQYCYDYGGYRECKEYKCINSITVEDAMEKIDKMLE